MELSELEKRVLAELAEFRCENFPALTNAVTEDSAGDAELSLIGSTFENLVRHGLVLVAIGSVGSRRSDDLSNEDSIRLLEEIERHLRVMPGSGHWTGGEEPWPELVITETGLKEAEKILDERGERWWLHGK